MKKIKGLFILTLICFGTYSLVFSSEISRVDNSAFKHPQRKPAVFEHDTHNEKAELEEKCFACHHVYEGKTLVEEESSEDDPCSSCHTLETTEKNSVPLRTAFHNRCKTCHFDLAKGPVLCGECHKK